MRRRSARAIRAYAFKSSRR